MITKQIKPCLNDNKIIFNLNSGFGFSKCEKKWPDIDTKWNEKYLPTNFSHSETEQSSYSKHLCVKQKARKPFVSLLKLRILKNHSLLLVLSLYRLAKTWGLCIFWAANFRNNLMSYASFDWQPHYESEPTPRPKPPTEGLTLFPEANEPFNLRRHTHGHHMAQAFRFLLSIPPLISYKLKQAENVLFF